MKRQEYPAWICTPCGELYGRASVKYSTFHCGDRCGWCGEVTITTQPRDYGYPPAPALNQSEGE
jgi:methionyl-tRNA synthetase